MVNFSVGKNIKFLLKIYPNKPTHIGPIPSIAYYSDILMYFTE